jgi:tetratricopeptide (TPR) repeat protein
MMFIESGFTMRSMRRLLFVFPALSFALHAFQAGAVKPFPTESRNIDAATARNKAELRGTPMLTGKVSLSDGGQPDDAIVIEFACGATIRSSVAADVKGRFSLPLSPSSGQASASRGISGNISPEHLDGCQLRAVLTGYRSDVIDLGKRESGDKPDVGTIVLHRDGHAEGTLFSVTTAGAPKDAGRALAKGRDAIREKRTDAAQEELKKAVRLYPKYAAAWFELGRLYETMNNNTEARKAYEQAIAADPKYARPLERLMMLAGLEGKSDEVATLSSRLIGLDPNGFPVAWLSAAIANLNLGNWDASEKSAVELIRLDTEHRFPKGEQILGVVLAQKQKWAESAVHLRRFLELAPDGADADSTRRLLPDIEQRAQAARK